MYVDAVPDRGRCLLWPHNPVPRPETLWAGTMAGELKD